MGIQAAIKGISYSWLSEVKTDMTNYVRCVYIYIHIPIKSRFYWVFSQNKNTSSNYERNKHGYLQQIPVIILNITIYYHIYVYTYIYNYIYIYPHLVLVDSTVASNKFQVTQLYNYSR